MPGLVMDGCTLNAWMAPGWLDPVGQATSGPLLPPPTRIKFDMGGWPLACCILDPAAWLAPEWLYPEYLDGS